MDKISKNTIYLLKCAINECIPDVEKLKEIDIDEIYRFSKFHMITGIIDYSLEKAGIVTTEFSESRKRVIRKNLLMDLERQSIIEEFEKNEIWYMPLKGIVLKEYYPGNGTREMSDNDILYDHTKQDIVKKIMEQKGYIPKSIGITNHDIYIKKPFYFFEMHTSLFNNTIKEKINSYYKNVKDLLIKDEKNKYGYYLSYEDFYIFMTAHEYKHFSERGTGLRSLLDCYIFLKVKNNVLDWEYINKEIEKLEITDFEEKRRQLAIKIFSIENKEELTKIEKELLEFYMTSGTYGNIENSIKRKLYDCKKEELKKQKTIYIIKRIFPKKEIIFLKYPIIKKYIFLLPFGYLLRTINAVQCKRKKIKKELNYLKEYDKEKI